MPNRLANISIVAAATFASRILGLVRDVIIFASLGATALNSAFLIAFTIPNLFRRLLGEGALTSALVPIYSEELEKRSREKAYQFLNKVVTRLALLLLFLVLLGSLLALQVIRYPGLAERWYLSAELSVLLLPYLLFVCLAAILGAVLNVLRRFTVAALSQVWINLSMILAIGFFGYFLAGSPRERVLYLCAGVLFGGLVQILIPTIALRQEGWRLRFDLKGSDRLREMIRLFLPGVLGAAILQVNFLISRLIALWLSDEAVAILYLATRLIELPLGMFVIAVTTVSFPDLARDAAKGEVERFSAIFRQSARLVLAITLPAALGLFLLRDPILQLLFQWGAFDRGDVLATTPVLAAYCGGLPFFAFAALSTRGFHALKDMHTPVRLTFINFILNVSLSLLLVRSLGMVGLALANVLAMVVHAVAMHALLSRKVSMLGSSFSFFAVVKIGGATLGMGIFAAIGWMGVSSQIASLKLASFVAVAFVVPVSALVYFLLLRVMHLEETREIELMVRRLLRY